jgi:NAD(P)-dependent dehydrogenase (short-subunit alcohol dehydrogenase family)
MATILDGTFFCSREFGKLMVAQKSGSIINIASIAGIIGTDPIPLTHYSAAKAGVISLTKSLAVEWATSGVRVNAIAPTYIETEMIESVRGTPLWDLLISKQPIQRFGTAVEIASIVAFLASDASSLMTGSIVVADGGATAI